MGKVISKLRNIQVAKGLSDEKMAKLLNCSRQLYQKTRTGETPLGNKILKGISAAFPELQKDVIYFLSCDANGVPKSANQNPLNEPSEAQGRGLKRFCVGLLGRIKRGWKEL